MNREAAYFILILALPFAFAVWWEWSTKRDNVRRKQRDAEYLETLGRMLQLAAQSGQNSFGSALSAAFLASLRRKDAE